MTQEQITNLREWLSRGSEVIAYPPFVYDKKIELRFKRANPDFEYGFDYYLIVLDVKGEAK